MKRTRRAISMIVAMAMMTPTLATAAEAALVNWLSPAPGQRITTRTVEVAIGYNTQSDQKVTSLELWVDGQMHARKYLVHPETRGVCSFVWDTARFSDGPHDLVVKVYSGDLLLSKVTSTGTVGSSAFDMEPPVVTFIGIKSGDVITGTSDIKIKATDDSGEQPLVSLLVDDSLKLIKNRAPYVYALDTTTYKNGSHELETFAYDSSGNKSNPSVVNVSFNNNAPLPVVTSVNVTPTNTVAASEDDGTSKIEAVAPVAKIPPVEAIAPKTQAARVADSVINNTTAARPAAVRPMAAPKVTPIVKAPVAPTVKMASAPVIRPVVKAVAEPVIKPAPRPAASVAAVTPLKTNQIVMAMATPEPPLTAAIRMAKPVAPALAPKPAPKIVQAPVSAPAKIALPAKPVIVSARPAELAPIVPSKTVVNVPSIRSEQHAMAAASGRAAEPKLVAPSVSSPRPILMAKAPDLRNSLSSDIISTASSSATEVLADPISSAPSKASVARQSADLRTTSQAGCASVGTRMALAPRTSSLVKPEVIPYVADANARAKVKTALETCPAPKIDHKAKLEKKVLPVSGKAKVRDLVNHSGGILFWDEDNRAVTAYVGNMELELRVGSNIAVVNGKEIKIDKAPYIAKGRMIIHAQVYQQALAIANSANAHTASAK